MSESCQKNVKKFLTNYLQIIDKFLTRNSLLKQKNE